MLVSTKVILEKAKQYGFGVAAPNVINMETVEAAFEAASELNAPIIIDVAEPHGVEKLGPIVKYYAEKFSHVIASLHLDHGTSFEIAIKAIKEGYTSIMVDRSTLPFEENVAQVKEIVKIAHAAGVSVEAELGHVGQGYEYEKTRDEGLTKVDEAVEYVKQTGVDMLAVAIGTSHGTYRGLPRIDFELLEKISSAVDVPLVIHGGSGTGDENLKKAVKMGIQKVNLFTDLSNAGLNAMYEYIKNGDIAAEEEDFETGKVVKVPPNLFNAFRSAKEGYKRMLKHYMCLFESDDKAGLYKI
ncbi:class II fructose-bisphosphate aldolase [Thermosediminibacter oceani]|uniref:Ketose-bisphosphate aldolase n=1 Tax=Thermosediminibacter oceani (strain ATCC BAA-1034 / DSM 16646 / JW/IW-1228P) TaxID=555079 RepID=D9RZ51_THEOJ|nr:class II fructose-bisphosphate aldolase [Thermosediminibacter oceani]ADL08605.1 ketose-bisphosphate aldolase [Thermosediminibacter oceani DSM 16646]